MATRFEQIISDIDNEISIQKEDRQAYTEDFDDIRNFVIDIMKEEDPVFKKLYGGPSLFGSNPLKLKLNVPDEFDVHILLKLPFQEKIRVRPDKTRPGFVTLCLHKMLKAMRTDKKNQDVYELFNGFVNDWKYLRRSKIHQWIDEIIKIALEESGNVFRCKSGIYYTLIYLKRGTAHTIKAISANSDRKISIDFVPAFKFDAPSDWVAKKPFPKDVKNPFWFAVPKPAVGSKVRRTLTFSICVPQIEKHILQNKDNLKSSLRLLKSLRDKIGGFRLKSYFIYTLYLHEIDNQPDEFWKQPKGFLLRHMIERLLEYLEEDEIPFYWDEDMNLLDGLYEDQVFSIKEHFENISKTLSNLYHQPVMNYSTVRNLFGNPKEFRTLRNESL